MISELYQKNATADKLYLDPRTKILMCLLVSTTLLSGSPIGYLKIFHTILSLLPFVFLVVLKKLRAVVYFFVLYLFALFVPNLLAPYLPTWFNILFTGIIAFSVEIIPGYMMAYFMFSTTSVGEFIATMDRMHVTKKLTVPISVTFRFFPTIREEYINVRDAMKLRGIDSFRNPLMMLEFRMVPFLTSIVSIGNDLAASALTRGLAAPNERTNVSNIGFKWRDYLVFGSLIIFYTLYFIVMYKQKVAI